MKQLQTIAKQIRKDIISMSYKAQSAHMGGALSCVEILTTLYFKIMKVYPQKPLHVNRDRLIFSKAHDAKALYSVLCRRGFFQEKVLAGYEQNGGRLPGHSTRHCVPGVEVSAGSLGHGLPMACGIALAGKRDHRKYRVFALISDGECDEGTTWESALFASQLDLDNLTVIIDYNKLQGFGYTKNVLQLEPLCQKWKSFGWQTREVNGHSFQELERTFKTLPFKQNAPSVVIAHTIKGFGGPPIHINQISSQYKPPTTEEYEAVINQLSQT